MSHVEIARDHATRIDEYRLLSDVPRFTWAIVTKTIGIAFDAVTHDEGGVAIIEVDIESTTQVREVGELVVERESIGIFVGGRKHDLVKETWRGGIAFDLLHLLQGMAQYIRTHAMRDEMHFSFAGILAREMVDEVFELQQAASKSEAGHLGVVTIRVVVQRFAIRRPTEDDDIVGAAKHASELSAFFYRFVEVVVESVKVDECIATAGFHVTPQIIKERHRPLLCRIRKDDRLLGATIGTHLNGADP